MYVLGFDFRYDLRRRSDAAALGVDQVSINATHVYVYIYVYIYMCMFVCMYLILTFDTIYDVEATQRLWGSIK